MQALRKDLVAARPVGAGLPALCDFQTQPFVSALERYWTRSISMSGKANFFASSAPPDRARQRCCAFSQGLRVRTEGKVLFEGAEISGPSRDRAIIFQDYSKALLPWRTVRGNVALSLEARNVPAAEQDAIIDELLGRMGLSQAKDQFPSQLSGGMQQRVQIARCLAQDPKLLLMDEPFGALDAMTRQTLQDEILQLVADKHIATVFITHDLEEAIYLGDRVVVLGGSPASVIKSMEIELPRPRNQLTTREDSRFLAYRHRLFELLVHERSQLAPQSKGQG